MRIPRLLRPLVVLLLGVIVLAGPAWAEFPLPNWLLPTPRVTLSPQAAAVSLDGRRLFTVAVPGNTDQDPAAPNPLQQRIDSIEAILGRLAASDLDPDTLAVEFRLDRASNQPVVTVNGQYLLTVTSLDAQLQGVEPTVMAQAITETVRTALLSYRRERQADYVLRQFLWGGGLLLGTLLLHCILERWRRRIERHQQAILPQAPALPPDARQRWWQQEHRLDLQRKVIRVGQIALWVGSITVALGLLPQIRWLQTLALATLQGPFLRLVIVATLTYLALRFSVQMANGLFTTLRREHWLAGIPSHRLDKRITTLIGIARGAAATATILLGCVVALIAVGLDVLPIVTSLGFIGLGLSLAGQDLIKDLINGLLILIEDQYAEGDVIVVDGKGGLVENMNLRITQLRNTEGNLITIPNSAIRVVENLSNGWSRVDLGIEVAYEADLSAAMRLIETVAVEMSQEPQWQDQILDRPQLLGVDGFGDSSLTIRLWIRVQPLKQWDVAREYRRRLKLAFDEAGIRFPHPHRTVWMEEASNGHDAPSRQQVAPDALQ